MKRWSYLLLACLMVLGFTQCKKDLDLGQSTTANTYNISLTVDDNSKVNVTPYGDHATVRFEDGDVIHVVYNKVRVGTISFNDDTKQFEGNISIEKTGDQKLCFYFFGSATPSYDYDNTNNVYRLTVDINDQKNKLPVISFSESNEIFDGERTTFSANLQNKCAFVKFTPNNIDGNIRMTGLKNRVRFYLNNNSYGCWETSDGYIDLHKVSNTECWAILLPQEATTTAKAKSFGYLRATGIEVPKITASAYFNSGIPINLTKAPEKAFSTSDNDTYVYFATGNLQCTKEPEASWDAGNYSWSFKTNQYDIDHYNTCDVGVDYANTSVISHFGWGASGFNINDGITNPADFVDPYALNYKPNSTAKDKTEDLRNPYHYGPSWTEDPASSNYNTAGVNISGSNFDWGVYHSPIDGNNWRLFTKAEIAYILGPNYSTTTTPKPGNNCRYSSTIGDVENARFVKVKLSNASNGNGFGLGGLIIFPDVYEHPDPSDVPYPSNINDLNCSFTANSYTIAQWELMEAKGAIFLPAAGCHDGNKIDGINLQCYYWTSTYNDYSKDNDNPAEYAKNLRVGDDSMVTDSRTQRYRGNSVRLVRDAN